MRGEPLIHFLGGGMWQVPSIRRARDMGYRVLVTDMYEDRPAYRIADRHEVIDICDREKTLDAARRHSAGGVVCDTTDVGVPTAAYVAERLGLAGIGSETARRFTDKHQMRELTTRAGLQDTRFRLVRSADELPAAAKHVGFPLVVKPIDNQSSRGVFRVNSPDELPGRFEAAVRCSAQRAVLLEELLPGIEVTVEGMCWGGKYYTLGISDKAHYPHRPEVAYRLTYPPAFPAPVVERIREMNEAVVRCLGLTNGVTHAEYMVDGDKVRLVEIAARGGGSRVYTHIAPHVSGVDVVGMYLRYLMGERPEPPVRVLSRAANLEFFSFPAGRVRAIHGLEEASRLPGVAEILLEFKVGDVLSPPDDDRSRPGLMVVLGDTREEVLRTSEQVKRTLRVEAA